MCPCYDACSHTTCAQVKQDQCWHAWIQTPCMSCECPTWYTAASHPSVTTHPVTFFSLTLVCLSPFCTCPSSSIHVSMSSRSLLTSPFFTHVYIHSQREVKEAEEEEKLTNSLKTKFQVSFTNWVSDARKIQWMEDKVCVCVCVCVIYFKCVRLVI